MTLTVTPPSGEPVTGVPVVFDDFEVSIRDASGKTIGLTYIGHKK